MQNLYTKFCSFQKNPARDPNNVFLHTLALFLALENFICT